MKRKPERERAKVTQRILISECLEHPELSCHHWRYVAPFDSMVVGTTNQGKVREVAGVCHPFGIQITPSALDVEETKDTFFGNAMLKAQAYTKAHPGRAVLVEDSGLRVEALDGLPGVWSARFADLDLETREVRPGVRPREEQDQLNNERLLELLSGRPLQERGGAFTICLIIAKDDEVLFATEQSVYGYIVEEPRGEKGFGYDPVFASEATFGKTFAEVDGARKNAISHRRKALDQMALWLAASMKGNTL